MTNIKKIFLAAMTALTFSFPVAYAADCQYGTKIEVQDRLHNDGRFGHHMLSDQQVAKIVEDKGPPPNGNGGPFEMEVITTAETGAIAVYEGECFINKLGPLPLEMMNHLLGENGA